MIQKKRPEKSGRFFIGSKLVIYLNCLVSQGYELKANFKITLFKIGVQ